MAVLDFGDLTPDQAPDKEQVKRALSVADDVTVVGPVSALGTVLATLTRLNRLDLGVAWIPSEDPLAAGLARTLGIDNQGRLTPGSQRLLSLVRDDHGGVLLARGRLTSLPKQAGTPGSTYGRFGAQIHHDKQKVADGEIMRVDVRPDWTGQDRLKVNVHKQLWRRGEITLGRAIQVACDEAQVEIDGVRYPRPVTTWTWYADNRFRWTLASA